MAYDWPGNVRQLEHVLLNAWILADDPELDVGDLALPGGPPAVAALAALPAPEPVAAPTAAVVPVGSGPARRSARAISQHHAVERDRIIRALEACNWNRVKAAELSGIPRRTFYRRLREYGIQ